MVDIKVPENVEAKGKKVKKETKRETYQQN